MQPIELDVWRSTLPALSAHYLFRAFRQVLEYAVAMGLLDVNPTSRIKNTRASVDGRREIHPFEDWEQVEAIAAEMDPRYAAIPIVLVGTGLRPEELFALERRDLNLEAGVLSVERVHSQGRLKEPKKSSRQRRRVPLRQRVVEALRTIPPRLDTPLVFPAARGGYIDGEKFRYRTGSPPSRLPTSTTAGSTTAVTRSRRGRSRAVCSCSTSPESWGRACRRSTRPMDTSCRTRSSHCSFTSPSDSRNCMTSAIRCPRSRCSAASLKCPIATRHP